MITTNVTIRKRITILFMIVSAILFFLLGRLAYIQFVKGNELQKMAEKNRMRDVRVEAKRGTIYDRNGEELVRSISSDTVYAIPPEIPKNRQQEIARKVSEILELDYNKVYKIITKKKSWFEYIKRKEPDAGKIRRLKALELPGIGFVEESRRAYPNKSLAAHILGFVDIDNIGKMGIENTMDRDLKGEDGWVVIEYDGKGREIPQAMHRYIPPKDGKNVILTIDETIQFFVERELDKIMEERHPKGASIIVMDPKTGEILAMGNRPTFDPGRLKDYSKEELEKSWLNRAIWLNYEPGSTFKIVTAASALEEGTVRPDDKFYDPGFVEVQGRTIHCWDRKGHGSQTFIEVVQNSCNPGFIKVGLDLGKEKFYRYINAFGFGRKTGLGLPGEGTGIIIPEKKATQLNLATMSIGQSISVTPIQLITAVSAVANEGKLMKPHLVKEVRDAKGKLIKDYKPEVAKQVISKETAKELANILENVVLYGSGKNAAVEGYRVAGKTGTAQKVGPNGGYLQGKYIASFVGFAPVEEPRIAILVVVDEAEGYPYYGSWVAAPHFHNIAKDALRRLGVAPKISPEKVEEEKKDTLVPGLVNMTVDEARKALLQAGLKAQFEGRGNLVISQMPKAGVKVPKDTTVIVSLAEEPKNVKPGQEVTVPDVTGMSIKEAASLLAKIGLHMRFEGTGIAVSQDVPPGTKVKSGSTVKVKFEAPTFNVDPIPEAEVPSPAPNPTVGPSP